MAMKFFQLHAHTAGTLPMYQISVLDVLERETGTTLDTAAMGTPDEIHHWCDLVAADVERIRTEALREYAKLRARIARGDAPSFLVRRPATI